MNGPQRGRGRAAAPFGRRASDRVQLTARQQEVLDAVSQGLENKEIARQLGISEQAVKQQVSVLLKKFGVPSRAMLVQQAMSVRLIGRSVEELDVPLEHFFDRAPVMMALLSEPGHRYTLVNREYVRFFGQRDYIGRTVIQAFPETDESEAILRLDQVYRTGEPYRATEAQRSFLRDGVPVEVSLTFTIEAIRDAAGTITALAIYGWDVTEAANTRRSLARANLEHQALLEQLPIGVVYTDDQARPVLMNRVARELFGDLDPERPIYTPLPGRTVRTASDGRPVAPEEGPTARAIGGWPFDGDLFVSTAGLTRTIHVSARPLHDERGRVTGAALVVSERPPGTPVPDQTS